MQAAVQAAGSELALMNGRFCCRLAGIVARFTIAELCNSFQHLFLFLSDLSIYIEIQYIIL